MKTNTILDEIKHVLETYSDKALLEKIVTLEKTITNSDADEQVKQFIMGLSSNLIESINYKTPEFDEESIKQEALKDIANL